MQRVGTLFLIYLFLLACISWISAPYRLKEQFYTGFHMAAITPSPATAQEIAGSYTAISGKRRLIIYDGSLLESIKTFISMENWGSSQADCETEGKKLCSLNPSCTAVQFKRGGGADGSGGVLNGCNMYSSQHTETDLVDENQGDMHWKKGGFEATPAAEADAQDAQAEVAPAEPQLKWCDYSDESGDYSERVPISTPC
jgi:hypothetical protein